MTTANPAPDSPMSGEEASKILREILELHAKEIRIPSTGWIPLTADGEFLVVGRADDPNERGLSFFCDYDTALDLSEKFGGMVISVSASSSTEMLLFLFAQCTKLNIGTLYLTQHRKTLVVNLSSAIP